MRLVEIGNDNELRLTKDLTRDVPAYTILSHVWGSDEEEVTFAEMACGNGQDKAGYKKLTFCRNRTLRDGLRHFWLDTCCIDKTNAVELSEAINSMFRWYSAAYRCYVLLSDVSYHKSSSRLSDNASEAAFRISKWFTRGWTLPELLAPISVEFFSKEEEFMGNKRTLKVLIHEITSIPVDALRGVPLDRFSIKERMSWVDQRKTTKPEDLAYCLLGIFNVFIPPIYGEGANAFIRLEEAITRTIRSHAEPEDSGGRKTQPSLRTTAGIGLFDPHIKALQSLKFEQMDTRHATISRAYSVTCRWLVTHPVYVRWNDTSKISDHGGLFWIKGKPGAGKSTLVKFIHAEARRTKAERDIIISFFFNARGSELERTTIGMYRSLLFQLMNEAPDLRDLLGVHIPSSESQSPDALWTVQVLCDLLSEAVPRLQKRRLTCFIDALDECQEQQVRDMVVFFDELREASLQQSGSLYICFASRHYPTIGIHECCELILENETAHGEDLEKYVHGHLLGVKTRYMQEVAAQVLKKASGVFLWVVLVINILNKEYSNGRMYAIKKRLQETPAQLSELFKDMLRRDSEDMSEFLLCLRLILYSKRPLFLEEYYFAMLSGLRPEDLSEWNSNCPTPQDMERFLLSCSKGLAELTKSRTRPTVQFIHESVRDFLVKDGGLPDLWPTIADVKSSSHDQIKACCQAYMCIDLSDSLPPARRLPEASSGPAIALRKALNHKYPFLEYAVGYVLDHADDAAIGIDQDAFLLHFPTARWIGLANVFETYELRRYTAEASLLYIFARRNLARLIVKLSHGERRMGNRGELYQFPLFAALAGGNRRAVRALFQHSVEDETQGDIEELQYGQQFSFKQYQTPLMWALERGHLALAQKILRSVDTEVAARDSNGRDALSRLAECGAAAGLQWLIDIAKVDVDSRDASGNTPLMYAAKQGHELAVDRLLEKGAVSNATNRSGETALILAATEGRKDIVNDLIYSGADAHIRDKVLRSALHHAAARGWESVVDTLLQVGVDFEATDRHRMTPLMLASHYGWLQCVCLLLQLRANTEHSDKSGRTAVILAARRGHETIVSVLLKHGALPTIWVISGWIWSAQAELRTFREQKKLAATSENDRVATRL